MQEQTEKTEENAESLFSLLSPVNPYFKNLRDTGTRGFRRAGIHLVRFIRGSA
jgi:hypothetical protein